MEPAVLSTWDVDKLIQLALAGNNEMLNIYRGYKSLPDIEPLRDQFMALLKKTNVV